jgi:ABC-type multidrug transport system fused ATPase/permease subunit
MERDPLRLAWATAPARHLLAGVLLVAAGGLFLVGLDLVRTLVDRMVAGGSGSATMPLLRLAVPLPERLHAGPLVLFPGISLDAAIFTWAALGLLVAIPILLALVLMALEWMGAGIGARVLTRLRSTILNAVLAAPPSAQDDAAAAATWAGDPLARESGVLGASLLMPLRTGGTMVLALAYVAASDWRLGAALAAMLILSTLAHLRRLDLRVEAVRARGAEGAAIGDTLADLLRRVPALRAHGTGPFERDRVSRALVQSHRPVESRERGLGMADAVVILALLLTPLVVLGAAWWAGSSSITGGTVLACMIAATLAGLADAEFVQWQRRTDQTHRLLDEMARDLAGLQTREHRGRSVPLPQSGALVAAGVSAYDPPSGGRISGVDLSLVFPAHVALVGDGDAGPRIFAALVGGQLYPSTGRLTYGGVDLAAADPVDRARRIAYAGGDTILIPGTLRQNLLYGCSATEPDLESRLAQAISATDLERLVHARGLAGTLDPDREPKLAAAIVESRRAVRAALAAEKLDRFVDPFDIARYNQHATVGENLLFGKPIGDTFREERLASHPFVRAILEAEDLTKPLAHMGLSIATSMIEIFADIPAGHPLFERFAFFSASDRTYFEDLVERRSERRRGAESARDRERLIGLALRYSESRHRLGLLDDVLRQRLLAARADFARMLPASLKPAIEFYDEGRLCTAASVQDNLLFGRIASDQAGAEAAVLKVVRRVLTERGLDTEVSRIGLETPVDIRGGGLTTSDAAAIDLARCLVRRPDVVVAERVLDGLPGPAADALVARLRRALVGRGLILVTSGLSPAMETPLFDAVIRFERGTPQVEDRRARVLEPVPA